jgi:N-acetylneuraminate synthase
MSFQIGKFTIGESNKPFVIAEMSGNHNQSLDRAMEIVKAASDSGAHAIKLQTYTADSMTINVSGGLFDIKDPTSLWKNRNLYELYQEAYTPYEWHKPLFEYAAKLGLECFSTPFDEAAVDFLETLNVTAYKIASFENNHIPLLKKVAKTGKPVIMSTGVANLSDIDLAVRTLRENGCKDLVLLKCTSNYPSTPENTNIRTIPYLKEVFNCTVGLSDHTMGVGAAVASIALGARVLEKHFCLSRAEGGVDSAFSMEPAEFKILVEESERAFLSLGVVQFGVQASERKSLDFKRSIYFVEDVSAGELLSEKNIRIIRPGDGLAPQFIDVVLGCKAVSNYKKGTPVSWDTIQ